MKILWLCNVMLPDGAKILSIPGSYNAGWIEGLLSDLKTENVEMYVCVPINSVNTIQTATKDNVTYIAVPKTILDPTLYDETIEAHFKTIIKSINPDIIHIFGTELPHTLAMLNAAPAHKTVISIQGLTSVLNRHYYANLPMDLFKNEKLKRLLRKNTIALEKDQFIRRGEFEIKSLRLARHVIGRTTWDYACTKQINPAVEYHFCNETLRDEFYKHKWNLDNCQKHSIFLSQGTYPIKGLHFMLEAMPEIIRRFPDTHLFVAGDSIVYKLRGIKGKIKSLLPNYSEYLYSLINKYNLKNKITFLGNLKEDEMCKQYLKSHVFVLPSSIENSPNSLGEAMLLGLPSVASCVGGVQDMLSHKEEGFIYQYDAPYMLAHYVCEIFSNDDMAIKMSQNARRHALVTHSKELNKKRMLEIYNCLAKASEVKDG